VESQNFESRKNVLKYDDVMDRQRKVIYGERREVLEGADIEDQVRSFIDDVVTGVVTGATQEFAEQWDLQQLWTDLKQIWPVSLDLAAIEEAAGGTANLNRDELIEALQADAQRAYDTRELEVGEEVMRELERRVLLSVLDRKWREHLYEMDYLREGIYLRAYSQRDPLVEYQREGFEMFATMMDGIKEEAVGFLFNLEVSVDDDDETDEDEVEVEEPLRRVIGDFVPDADAEVDADDPLVASGPAESPNEELESPAAAFVRSPQIKAKGLQPTRQAQKLSYSAPSEDGEAQVKAAAVDDDDPFAKVGRNAQCPCGSGKKYKLCHGRPGGPTGLTARAAGG
jgi:preprotein translocase subunit SecA